MTNSNEHPTRRFWRKKGVPLGTVTLSIMVGDYPQQITKDITFLVVDCLFAYNAILG